MPLPLHTMRHRAGPEPEPLRAPHPSFVRNDDIKWDFDSNGAEGLGNQQSCRRPEAVPARASGGPPRCSPSGGNGTKTVGPQQRGVSVPALQVLLLACPRTKIVTGGVPVKYRFVSHCHFQACACHFGSPVVSQADPDVLAHLGAGNPALCCSRDPCSFPTGCSSHNPPGCTHVARRAQPKIAQMLPVK